MTLSALIAELEAAEQGSEALDKAIARQLGFRIAASTGGPHIMHQNDDMASWDLPKYSRSLDAALSLVPELCYVRVGYWAHGENVPLCWRALIWPPGPIGGPRDDDWTGNAPTPALALCIASLKAREAVS